MVTILKSSFLTQKVSFQVDQALFKISSLSQLMEIAGLSVAQCIYDSYNPLMFKRPLIICGPGNNGGDGFVAAKYLKTFGYNPSILCPKPSLRDYYTNLRKECNEFEIDELVDFNITEANISEYDLIVDAIFGVGFEAPIREPFRQILNVLKSTKIPIVSIDVPSGWEIDETNYTASETLNVCVLNSNAVNSNSLNNQNQIKHNHIEPECLISLTWPKICSLNFKGKFHYLAGRFVPRNLCTKYSLDHSVFPNNNLFVKLDL